MVLRLLYSDSRVHGLWPLDPSVEVQAGQIGGLIQVGGEIYITLADGVRIPAIGIIDEVRTESFSKPILDEVQVIPAPAVDNGFGVMVTSMAVKGELQETNIIPSSFVSSVNVLLNAKNGIITVPAGTPINFDNNQTQAVEVVVSYRYRVADLPGEDSTAGSGQASVHFARGFFSTDQFETQVDYQINDLLYCSPAGTFTTEPNGSAIAIVTAPPSAIIGELELMWL